MGTRYEFIPEGKAELRGDGRRLREGGVNRVVFDELRDHGLEHGLTMSRGAVQLAERDTMSHGLRC